MQVRAFERYISLKKRIEPRGTFSVNNVIFLPRISKLLPLHYQNTTYQT